MKTVNHKSFSIFIVEDDPWYGKILEHHLSLNEDYDVQLFTEGKSLMQKLHEQPDLICMDFGLPDVKGEVLLQDIKSRTENIPVIVISAQEDISVAVELLKAGADDYIIKDDHTKDILWKPVIKLRENQTLKKKIEVLSEQLEQKFDFEKTIKGDSPVMKKSFKFLQKAITSKINVHITGETGTGKEVYAKTVHFNSDRKKQAFVAVNMAAIPNELIESELFGYEKGAFTGAVNAKVGKFEEAHGGTLFLDEIGDAPLEIQSKLLRVLQEREVTRIGSNKPKKIDIRLITATHKKLVDEVRKGNFREDFFFRIMGLPIEIPALRERGADIFVLSQFFADEYSKDNSLPRFEFSKDALQKLKKHRYPGNVRELKASVDLACVMASENKIEADDISFYEIEQEQPYALSDKSLKDYENEIISKYLDKYEQNVLKVADKLKVGKSKIYSLIKSGEINLNS